MARARKTAGKKGEGVAGVHLDFEKPLLELEQKIEELKQSADAADLNVHREVASLERRGEGGGRRGFSSRPRYTPQLLVGPRRRPLPPGHVALLATGAPHPLRGPGSAR